MRFLQFSIARSMAIVAVIGLSFAALRSASDLWRQAAFSLALAALGVAFLGIIYRRGRKRSFWVGFALFGWGYMLLCFGPWFDTFISPRLLTRALIFRLSDAFHPRPTLPQEEAPGFGTTADFMLRSHFKTQENFRVIGHSLASLLIGLAGGLAATWFWTTRDEGERPAG